MSVFQEDATHHLCDRLVSLQNTFSSTVRRIILGERGSLKVNYLGTIIGLRAMLMRKHNNH